MAIPVPPVIPDWSLAANALGNKLNVKIPALLGQGGSSVFLFDPLLPSATVGTPYSQSLTGGGGAAPYSFALAPGSSLPDGLTLSSSGVISGTPTATGTSIFTVKITDTHGNTGSQMLSITVNAATSGTTASGGNYGFFT